MRICVFCGSATGWRPEHGDAARELGRALARRRIGLVNGGGRVGLMGATTDGALELGGEAVGVIPRALMDRELGHKGMTHLHVVETMHDRKALMAELSDGFVALPGGIGDPGGTLRGLDLGRAAASTPSRWASSTWAATGIRCWRWPTGWWRRVTCPGTCGGAPRRPRAGRAHRVVPRPPARRLALGGVAGREALSRAGALPTRSAPQCLLESATRSSKSYQADRRSSRPAVGDRCRPAPVGQGLRPAGAGRPRG